ncbi:hypothetical protein [Meiothermus cerbereus]|uniref:hypothetical protein n=1 Tax=Meiothermus cerbereus TaxID=65552 RepID=UPI00047FE108|nr:hypothetical protein [Meiothermus cerbereus]
MPSARGLQALKQARPDKAANLEQLLAFLHDRPGVTVQIRCAELETAVRFNGLEEESGQVQPRYGIYLYTLREWLDIGEQTFRTYLGQYGPYTWEEA